MKQMRRRAREFALQGVYQCLLTGADTAGVDARMQLAPGFSKADGAYFNALLYGIIGNLHTLDTQLASALDRPVAALSPVEHAALLMGVYELTHQAEIPYRVVINEAVELTKTFGGTDGYKYVNGVLDKLAARQRASE